MSKFPPYGTKDEHGRTAEDYDKKVKWHLDRRDTIGNLEKAVEHKNAANRLRGYPEIPLAHPATKSGEAY